MINAPLIFGADVEIRLSSGQMPGENDFKIYKHISKNGMRVSIKNISDTAKQVKEIALFAGNIPVNQAKVYGEGYHMLCQYRGDMSRLEVVGAYGDDKSFFHLVDNPYDAGHCLVYYLLQLSYEGEHSLIAFASCHKFLGKFRFSPGYLEAVMDCEDIVLQPGAVWDMEELVVFSGSDANALYYQLGAAINANHPPMKSSWNKIPTGWCSYYCVGTFSPAEIYKNAEAMAARIPELEMIQIDAGLNKRNGDWNEWKFDDDLAAACEKVRGYGVDVGGYYSPFVVDNDSTLAKNHPDWLVKDEEGRPTNRRCRKESWFILDGSHPEARAHLKKLIRYMYDECGLRYFKLDFLSYGALPAGVRYDSTITSIEAYRIGMKAILEEVGEDSFVLACNAPFWPTLGLCHANRTTNDIFRGWKQVGVNALEQFYRNWQHQRLWINDPDVVVLEKLEIVRTKDGKPSPRPCTLTDAEFEFHKAFAVACGGMILSGDLLYEISDANIEVLKKMKNAMGEAAVFDNDNFEVGRFMTKDIICLFNWNDLQRVITADIEGTVAVKDFFTEEEIGKFEANIAIELPPHGGKVLTFTKLT
ncbi:MAG: alpha-galactosidase [Defluviitaleaceae bacterium]|nr:alpha-galactosidase [Defluviitaleaceae bacterium]